MINVTIKPREVIITGHAMSDKKGKDLVCCSVSTLYYSLVANLLHNVKNKKDIEYDGEDGHARVKALTFNRELHRCFKFFKVSIKELEKQYPTYIKIL